MAFIALYLASIVTINILYSIIISPLGNFEPNQQLIFEFGIEFIFIGLCLGARDKLHEIWKNSRTLFRDMVLLVFLGGGIGYISNFLLLSDDTIISMSEDMVHKFALGSFFAFASSGLINFLFYHLLRRKSLFNRIMFSNIPAAIIDTLLFSFVAYGFSGIAEYALISSIIPKILGGLFWGMLLVKFRVIG